MPVNLDLESHKYTNDDGDRFYPVTSVIKNFVRPFPKEYIAGRIALRDNRDQQDILDEWDALGEESVAHGKRIHDVLEKWFTGETFDIDGNEDLIPLIESLEKDYSVHKKVESEVILFDEETMIAGMADKILYRTKYTVDIDDFKTNLRKGIEFDNKRNDYMLYPLNHLLHCNYHTYSLQLSFYAWLLQKTNPKMRIGRLCIVYIAPDTLVRQRIPVPYMKYEVEKMIEVFHERPQEHE